MSNATRRIVTTRMTLDLSIPDIQRDVTVTQGDTNRRFEITLVDSGHPYVLNANDRWSVILTGVRPSGATLNNGCDVAGGKILYDFASGDQITTEAGAFSVQFNIYDETGEVIATPKIWVTVTPNANRNTKIEDQYTAVSDWIATLNQYEESEGTREENENTRQTNEAERKTKEDERKAAEEQRKQNEVARQGLQQQVNNLLNVPEGSTTADLALYDLKLGADGVTYETPGIAVRTQLGRLQGKVPEIDKRLSNVESLLDPQLFVDDNTAAAVKDVPENAAPYAKVSEIGGKTRKCANWIPRPYVFEKTGRTENGLSVTVRDDGTIVLNGTHGGTDWEWLPIAQWREHITDETDTGVSFPGKGRTFTFSGMIDGGSEHTYMLRCVGGTDAYYLYNSDEYAVWRNVDYTFCTVNLMIAPGVTFNNVELRPMINEGSTPLPYEPYFSGLRSAPVTEVESVGVNLFDKSKVVIGRGIGNEGIPYNWDGGFYSAPIAVIEGKTYAFAAIAWHNFFSDDGAPSLNNAVGIASSGTFVTIPSGAKFVRITAKVENIDLAMVSESTTARPYTPYVRHTLPIPAEVQALDGYGWGVSESVYNYIDWGKRQFVKRVEKIVLSGNELWTVYNGNMVSTHLDEKVKEMSPAIHDCKYEMKVGGGNSKLVALTNNEHTVESWKAYLSENPVTIYYELAAPVVTDISDLLPADNYIGVEGGGRVTMVSEYGYDVPSKVRYQLKRTGKEVLT